MYCCASGQLFVSRSWPMRKEQLTMAGAGSLTLCFVDDEHHAPGLPAGQVSCVLLLTIRARFELCSECCTGSLNGMMGGLRRVIREAGRSQPPTCCTSPLPALASGQISRKQDASPSDVHSSLLHASLARTVAAFVSFSRSPFHSAWA